MRGLRATVLLVAAGAFVIQSVEAQATVRVSDSVNGIAGNHSSEGGCPSADGRFVAFTSAATNLMVRGVNGLSQVYVRDMQSRTTALISVASDGSMGNLGSFVQGRAISADGRYVVFTSLASNLVPGDTNGSLDVFVRDREAGTTERVSIGEGGIEPNDASYFGSISADGRYVAFVSIATNIVSGDTNGMDDVFLFDRATRSIERVSVDSQHVQGDDASGVFTVDISADGRYVAFDSFATNLVPGDLNFEGDVFVHDAQTGTTALVNRPTPPGTFDRGAYNISISGDGRLVAFVSWANDLVPTDTCSVGDVFVRDLVSGTTELVSRSTTGQQGPSSSGASFVRISENGRIVVFDSGNPELVDHDTNGLPDVLLHDMDTGVTELVSVGTTGVQTDFWTQDAWPSSDGSVVAFSTQASTLVPGEQTFNDTDVFLRERNTSEYWSLCEPHRQGVRACPCANDPIGIGGGCRNSAVEGGAQLQAEGRASMLMDTLKFGTLGEPSKALSTLMQGKEFLPEGRRYGQGVRCVGGELNRLFTRTASNGSITVPDVGSGDPAVSTRSLALGDLIQVGEQRWYFVYYRDPVVPGGCGAGDTFNASQTRQVTWTP